MGSNRICSEKQTLATRENGPVGGGVQGGGGLQGGWRLWTREPEEETAVV